MQRVALFRLNSKQIIARISEVIRFYLYLHPLKGKAYTGEIASIFGSPRSGTTWLYELLSLIPNSAYVSEPLFRYRQFKIDKFNPYSYSEQLIKGLGWSTFKHEDEDWEELKYFFKQLFGRQIINIRLYRWNEFSKVKRAEYLIFKFCFGNLLLPWIAKRFNIAPIFIVRHPCAVVASQLSFGSQFQWQKDNYTYLKDNFTNLPPIYQQYKRAIDVIHSPEGFLAFQWGIHNHYLIHHKKNNILWLTVCYEDLLKSPMNQIQRIYAYLNQPIPHNIDQVIKSISFSSSKEHSREQVESGQQLRAWKYKMTNGQIDDILEVINAMGISYYSDELEPDYSVLYNL